MTVSPGFTATEIREIVHEYQVQPHVFSPSQVHDGSWREAWQTREHALQRYFQAHPERFRARPSTPTPAGTVGINLPNEKPQNKAA